MAKEHGRSIASVASDSYALTLWTFQQSEEAAVFENILREFERIDAADMLTRGFIKGTEPLAQRFHALRRKATQSPTAETKEQLARHADDLWALHERGMKSRPVS